MDVSVTADLTGWLARFQIEADSCLADLAQVCNAAEQKTYSENLAAHQFGITRLVLDHAAFLGENASERASRTCFLSAIGKLISFLDKLIASQRTTKLGSIPITRALNGEAEIYAYLNEYMEAEIAKVDLPSASGGLKALIVTVCLRRHAGR
jgi:hypothetical protein